MKTNFSQAFLIMAAFILIMIGVKEKKKEVVKELKLEIDSLEVRLDETLLKIDSLELKLQH